MLPKAVRYQNQVIKNHSVTFSETMDAGRYYVCFLLEKHLRKKWQAGALLHMLPCPDRKEKKQHIQYILCTHFTAFSYCLFIIRIEILWNRAMQDLLFQVSQINTVGQERKKVLRYPAIHLGCNRIKFGGERGRGKVHSRVTASLYIHIFQFGRMIKAPG